MPDNPVVVAALIGGLGNQMFQYAVARSLADRHGASLLLDTSGFENYPFRRYELGELNIRADIAQPADLLFFKRRQHMSWLSKTFDRMVSKFHPDVDSRIFNERAFAYDENIYQQIPPVYLSGYWQSERYFSDKADAIRVDLSLRRPVDEACHVFMESIRNTTSVSLHVRRGDYVSNAVTARVHGTCSLDYYRAAIAYIASSVEDPHFFIFSDDIDWAAYNLRLTHMYTLVDINGVDRGVMDMALMKACRHHIIANSSFSWWAAWLNPSSDKIVVAPQRWFNEANHDTRDLLPANWVKL